MYSYPLQNKVQLLEEHGDYLCIGKYISEYNCEIIIKRFDSKNGWNKNLKCKIDNQQFKIPESNNSNMKYSFQPISPLSPINLNYVQKIPKVIFQTGNSNNYDNMFLASSLIDLNPEYEYKFFNDIDKRKFIKNNFEEHVIDAYDLLVPEEYKSDLFKYCYLYKNGGCYIDYNIIAREPLRNIIKPDDIFLLSIDTDIKNSLSKDNIDAIGYSGYIIMCTPNNEKLLNLIDTCIDNILNKQYLVYDNIFLLTGKKLMYNVLKHDIVYDNLRFKNILPNNQTISDKLEIIDIDTKNILFTKLKFNYDSCYQLCKDKEIFYKNKVNIANLSVFIYPHPYSDSCNFIINEDSLYLERNGSLNLWTINIDIKLVDNITSNIEYINIGQYRCIFLQNIKPILLKNVFFSGDIKNSDLIFNENSNIIFISPEFISAVNVIRNLIPNSIIILVSTQNTIEIQNMSKIVDYVILYTGAETYYYCIEKNLKEVYISIHVLNLIKDKKFNSFKFLNNYSSYYLIKHENIDRYINFCKIFLKSNNKDINEFINFSENFTDIDFDSFYQAQLLKYNYVLTGLNNIVNESGEKLEGNVFYDHNSYKEYKISSSFKNKRYNLFYYSRQAYNILEIGFNAGHSVLLYLISNTMSKIQLFDLGDHSYSRKCFEYLDKEFPGRISIIWGDSTKTLETFKTDIIYDFIHIDGGHTRFVAETDFYNCKRFADNNSLVLTDDTNYEPLFSLFTDITKYKIAEKLKVEFNTYLQMLLKYNF